jgi:hypothetical protein
MHYFFDKLFFCLQKYAFVFYSYPINGKYLLLFFWKKISFKFIFYPNHKTYLFIFFGRQNISIKLLKNKYIKIRIINYPFINWDIYSSTNKNKLHKWNYMRVVMVHELFPYAPCINNENCSIHPHNA